MTETGRAPAQSRAPAGHDWRLVPLAVSAWVGAWAGTAGFRPEPGIWFCVLAFLGILALQTARAGRTWLALTIVVAAAVGTLSGAREVQQHSSQPAVWAQERGVGTARLRLLGDPRTIDSGVRGPLVVATARLLRLEVNDEAVTTRQQIVVFSSGEAARDIMAAAPGSVLEVTGGLAPAERSAPEALVLRARSVSAMIEGPGPLDRLVNRLRAGLREAASHSPPDQAALVPSLVVGDTSGIREQVTDSFKATSLSHLLAVSGANLTLMLVVVLAFVRFIGLRGWAVRWVALACIGLFVVVCRQEPSVVRAAAMGLISLSALGTGRGLKSLRHLAFAILGLLLLDPWLSRSWGFALSVAACTGLTLLAPGWIRALERWLPRWLAEAVAVPLAAQIATQPLITALSGQVSVIGVVANMAAAPFVGPATVLGLVATCLVWAPWLAVVAAWLAGWCVQPILWIAALGSSLPSAYWNWPADPLGITLCVVACAAGAWLLGPALSRPLCVLALVAVMVGASLVRPVQLGWPGPWQVVFCDVGQGDATILRAGDGAAIVVDTGPDPEGIRGCLASLGIRRVPLLVLTHYHSDHVGGAAEVIRRFSPEVVLVSRVASPQSAARAVAEDVADTGGRLVTAEPGQVLRVGTVTWTTVGAHEPRVLEAATQGESSDENDSSVVGLADVAGLRVLLPGDVEPDGQRRALASAAGAGLDLGVHVLKLPHHGSSRQLEQFFAASGAALAVASAGEGNDYGHPAASALDLAISHGMAVARTDEQGSVAVSIAEGQLSIRSMRGHKT